MKISAINCDTNFGSRRAYGQQNISATKRRNASDAVDYFSQGYRRLDTINEYGNRSLDAFNETIEEMPYKPDELLKDYGLCKELTIEKPAPSTYIIGYWPDIY